jgi:lysophospholipase L1-like esterase
MMSVADALLELAAAQRKLVALLQAEYYCDDLELPDSAFGWDEQRIRAYYEAGGNVHEPQEEVMPVPPRAPSGAAARPAIVCFGDGCVQLASHMLTAESVKHEKAPPLVSELLASEGPAMPIAEQGPGWLALLARDYAWRGCADVVNRGLSGYTTRMFLADLPATLASLPADVLVVVLQFGSADLSAEGPLHVPVGEFATNLEAIVSGFRSALPAAKIVVMTPPAVVDSKWVETKRASGGPPGPLSLSLSGLKPYVTAAIKVAKAQGSGCSLVDLHSGMMSRLMQFNDALGPTGRHLSQKGNNFCYRMLKEHLSDDLKIGPRSLTPHRPAAHVAAYPDGTDNDAKLRKKPR